MAMSFTESGRRAEKIIVCSAGFEFRHPSAPYSRLIANAPHISNPALIPYFFHAGSLVATTGGADAWLTLPPIHFNSIAKSPADCQRSSGLFCKHR
jgi:hypothetical protein